MVEFLTKLLLVVRSRLKSRASLAAGDTVFFTPELDIGLPLAWGEIPMLVREIGPAMTKELVMTCRRFSAGPTPFADGDVLLAAVADEELQQSVRAYMEVTFGKK